MSKTIALAGNPNCGKTTLFNALTGATQYVGNWPGVTVEKKEGKLKGHKEVSIMDLPGIYSLSPYTLEEVVARDYLATERPDCILNIIDGTNLERNLYLTTQLSELGIPMVVVVNMMDLVRKSGETIHTDKLAEVLKCPVFEISALKNEGIDAAVDAALKAADQPKVCEPVHRFSAPVEHALAHIEEYLLSDKPEDVQRFYAVKLFERDEKVAQALGLTDEQLKHIEGDITAIEAEADDDSESIITGERYDFIGTIIDDCYKRKNVSDKLTTSDKIDRIVTNRILALPIFIVIMFLVYYISVTTVGTVATDWANDGVFGDGWFLAYEAPAEYTDAADAFDEASSQIEAFEAAAEDAGVEPDSTAAASLEAEYEAYDDETGEDEMVAVSQEDYLAALEVEEPDPTVYGIWIPGIPVLIENGLSAIGVVEENADGSVNFVYDLIMNGIVAGVGAVLGFVPQMLVLFFLLAILELCGYMSRVAFILDRIFRRFGLSGKSFIPLLIGTGCGVPGVMASRTIEDPASRRMTVMTTTFMPCGAKLPVIALFAGAIFGGAWWVAPSAYFLGIASVLVSGIVLKKTRPFAGEVTPFVMELPAYHIPTIGSVLRSMWERAWAFIKKACTILLVACICIWFLSTYGIEGGALCAVEDTANSFFGIIGGAIAFLFYPLGWADWQAVAATLTGFLAKEELVATFGILYSSGASDSWFVNFMNAWTPAAAYSMLAFNLLCMPCFAAVTTIAREMNSAKWTFAAIGYEFLVAYLVALWVYQFAGLATGVIGFSLWTVVAVVTLAGVIYMLVRPNKYLQKANQPTHVSAETA